MDAKKIGDAYFLGVTIGDAWCSRTHDATYVTNPK